MRLFLRCSEEGALGDPVGPSLVRRGSDYCAGRRARGGPRSLGWSARLRFPTRCTRRGRPVADGTEEVKVDLAVRPWHNIHMKRTNLVLDEQVLEEATRLAGNRTYSGTVNLALRDFVRRARAHRILELAGSGLWEGELGEMRQDRTQPRLKRGKP